MSKVSNMRERVHQPFRDALIRTSGAYPGELQDQTELFVRAGKPDGESNLKQGSVLPSDQSMVILVLRCLLHFRAPVARSKKEFVATDLSGVNGDFFIDPASPGSAGTLLNGNVPGDYHDVDRLYKQASEQLLWDFGCGEKVSIRSMPSSYFPWGAGLVGELGGVSDLIHYNNGDASHEAMLRLGRAVGLVPRQNVTCKAAIARLPGTNAAVFNMNQGPRDMLNLRDNLNAVDLVQKTIAFCFDGLFSRDVQ
jgi:hypothetical protein